MQNKLIAKILNDPELLAKPPVLLDIGASGGYHRSWLPLAKYSTCLAFDADDRKFGVVEKKDKQFKKLLIYHSLVYHENIEKIPFYLTESPYCSSTLEPDAAGLHPWAFASKFNVLKRTELNAITLPSALSELNLNYVDWFKTDTQGIDLRLFQSLPDGLRENVLAVELEPGIIDSYKGEDKLHEVLRCFDGIDYWLSSINVKGFQRFSESAQKELSGSPFIQKLLAFSLKSSPGWGELFYLHKLSDNLSRRSCLLLAAIALLRKQYGFMYEVSKRGFNTYSDPLFSELIGFVRTKIRMRMATLHFLPAIFQKIDKMLFERF